jgi:EAL domain-containing protein (putative c-di-GMP-specific phosphodiesterase class I)
MTLFTQNLTLQESETQSAHRACILLVDDDQDLLGTYRAALGNQYNFLTANNGLQALAVLGEHEVNLILSDISMPDMDGVELLKEIRGRDLDVPVVLITGDPNVESAIQAVDYGAMKYLTKPVNVSQLQQVVANGLGWSELANAKRDAHKLVAGTPGMAADRAGQIARFERAMGSLYLAFQPIVSVETARPVGFECLLRCDEPSLQSPPDFIRVAEELGRIHEVSRAIRAKALAVLPEVPDDAALFVNLHSTDLDDAELFDPSTCFGLAASRMVLEITERESLQSIASAGEKVHSLRDMGFRIAMDDLGAGHNGLAAFARLSPEVVKLDMALVRGVERESHKHGLIGIMREYCRKQGILFIAEGVETRSELDALLELGCDLFQGYYFAKPNPKIVIPEMPL